MEQPVRSHVQLHQVHRIHVIIEPILWWASQVRVSLPNCFMLRRLKFGVGLYSWADLNTKESSFPHILSAPKNFEDPPIRVLEAGPPNHWLTSFLPSTTYIQS